MVTASQLQILQSPISSLISTVSTSVTVKLDETNYLVWHFQMLLLLEGHGILGFVDGSTSCPLRFALVTEGDSQCTTSSTESDDYKIWKMHDRALMQLITATLSPSAVSCVIGSTSARDIWTRLKEQFSTVTRTSIFQMKSELQNIKKGNDSISLYLQRIKEARDYLSAAGVKFDDDDIVILTLNGLSSEYNTMRSIIRGREHVISLKDLRSQLLAEEAMLESASGPPFLTAMVAGNSGSQPQFNGKSGPQSLCSNPSVGFPSAGSNGNNYGSQYKPFYNKNKGRGKFQSGSKFGNNKPFYPNPARGILGNSPTQAHSGNSCQICGKYGHLADTCRFRNTDCAIVEGCQICGRKNHSASFCHFRNANVKASSGSMNAMHVTASPSPLDSSCSQQVWLTDSGATNHMTADLKNLSLATPFPSNEMIQTASGEGQSHGENFVQRTLQ